MLHLLIKTRLQYYRNYIRYHFDKITILEIGFIFLIFLFLIGRSPADIGYNFQWLFSKNFPDHWATIFAALLPLFYLVSEGFAIYTLRPSKEWQIFGSLPFTKRSIASYYLIRHLSKTVLLIFVLSLLFFGGREVNILLKLIRFIAALGILFSLQLLAFSQATGFRNPHLSRLRKMIQWLFPDIFSVGLLILAASPIKTSLAGNSRIVLSGLLAAWFFSALLLKHIQKSFSTQEITTRALRKSTASYGKFWTNMMRGKITAFMWRDILYLWRQKRSAYLVLLIGSIIMCTICFAEENVGAVYVSLIFVEIIFSLLLLNFIVKIFEQEVESAAITRVMPISARTHWWSRWLLVVGFISVQMLVPIFIILLKGISVFKFILFALSSIAAIPAVLATLYCNACYGLFPQTKLAGYIVAVSILMIFLFWFFMPFGSLILLVVMIFWIRKSQKHLRYLGGEKK